MAKDKKAYNAADEKLVEDAAQKAKNKRNQELVDIKDIISTPAGLRFFRRLLEEGRVFRTTFTGNSQGYFLEGHRNLALRFFDDIAKAAPNKIAELMIRDSEEDGEV